MSAALGLAISLFATVVAMPLVIRVLRQRAIIDTPNARSSHDVPTPRGGGLGVAFGILLAAVVAFVLRDSIPVTVLVAGFALGVVGFWDDVRSLDPVPRLAGQLLVGGAVGFLIGGLPIAVVGAVVLPLGVNAVNFMDGINGISGVSMAVWGLGMYLACREVASDLAWLGAAVAGSALGFLVFNFPNAKVFLGDAGSYLFGAIVAAGSLAAIVEGAAPLVVIAACVLYLVDVLFTLAKRALRRQSLLQAHREHVYQLLTVRFGHGPVTLVIGLTSLLMVAVAAATAPMVSIGVMVAVAVAYVWSPQLTAHARVRRESVCE